MKELIVSPVYNDRGNIIGQEYHGALVRCKDCEWYVIAELKKDGTDDRRYKPSWCARHHATMCEKDYCSWAERKEE